MSLAPYVMPSARTGQRMGHGQLIDSMITDGLWDAFNDYHMGITAENLVDQYGLSREQQDAFAAESQRKAVAAIEAGRFDDEITPIVLPQKRENPKSSRGTSSRVRIPLPNPRANCARRSRRTAALPPATPQA